MRHANWLVFDEYLQSASPIGPTSQEMNSKLGMYDQLALQAVVDNVSSGAGGFAVQLYHSSDGRNWLPKNTPGGVSTPEIGGTVNITLIANTQLSYFGYDAGAIPSLALLQIRVFLGSSAAAHVRVYAAARDWGG